MNLLHPSIGPLHDAVGSGAQLRGRRGVQYSQCLQGQRMVPSAGLCSQLSPQNHKKFHSFLVKSSESLICANLNYENTQITQSDQSFAPNLVLMANLKPVEKKIACGPIVGEWKEGEREEHLRILQEIPITGFEAKFMGVCC